MADGDEYRGSARVERLFKKYNPPRVSRHQESSGTLHADHPLPFNSREIRKRRPSGAVNKRGHPTPIWAYRNYLRRVSPMDKHKRVINDIGTHARSWYNLRPAYNYAAIVRERLVNETIL